MPILLILIFLVFATFLTLLKTVFQCYLLIVPINLIGLYFTILLCVYKRVYILAQI